uniref:Uncharacterized protein n=1 Tax=Haptolina brevifila TaxID=156173 RepID=A0A7S2DQ76_9EUKA|mmetsp:Transcript_4145/g.9004  ORF Transcript_4145/g.9004 Transcript_4145/m.9004 type:complete len:636 (+) Transcript_4145:108-2015(+)
MRSILALSAAVTVSGGSWVPGLHITARSGLGLAELDGQLYATGGCDNTGNSLNVTEVFDPAVQMWKRGPPLPSARGYHGVAVLNDKLYAIGGWDSATQYALSTVDRFSAKENAWASAPAMHTPRNGLAVTAAGGRIYAIGGFNSSSRAKHSMEFFDPLGNFWTHGPRLIVGRAYAGAVAFGNKLYVIGGSDNADFSSMEVLDLASLDEWAFGKSSPPDGSYSYSYTYSYDPSGPHWKLFPAMEVPRVGPAVAVLDGKIFVIGGGYTIPGPHPRSQMLRSAEVYDPTSNTWMANPPPDMGTGRQSASCAILDSSLYVAGGFNNTDTFGSVEVFGMPANCYDSSATPIPSPAPPSPSLVTLDVYRVQMPEWVTSVANADVADLHGLACYIEGFPPENYYPKGSVLAHYKLQAFTPDTTGTKYPNCPDVDTSKEPPPIIVNRTCIPEGLAKVGRAAQCTKGGLPCDCQSGYGGYWYGLPAAGECKPGGALGVDCFWRIWLQAFVPFTDCVRRNGCLWGVGNCPPEQLSKALEACQLMGQDRCTPRCRQCNDTYASSVSRPTVCNEYGRLAFDPSACEQCIASNGRGFGWYLAPGNTGELEWQCDSTEAKHIAALDQAAIYIGASSSNASLACRCRYAD